MSAAGQRWLTRVLFVAALLLLATSVTLFWNYGHLRIQTAFAKEQIQIFEEMRQNALTSDAKKAAECLRYASDYYPSGTKQERGSALDSIVEHHRTEAIRAIIAHLRRSTGEDLGESPEAWITKYANQ